MKFTPTEDFWSEEMKSQYVKGLTYSVRPADAPEVQGASKHAQHARAQRAKLAELVKGWRATGKVVVAGDDAPEASVAGAGEVR